MSQLRCPRAPLAGRSRWVGDPVDVVTGVLSDHETDFRVQTGGLDFSWVRYFDGSQVSREADRGVGRGMRHALDYTLAFDLDGLTLSTPDGAATSFGFLESGGIKPRQDGDTLRRLQGQTYEVRCKDGRGLLFSFGRDLLEPARLLQLSAGDTLLDLRYGADDLLEEARFGDGTSLRVTWREKHLRQVSYVDAKSTAHKLVRYRYDEAGRLVRIDDAYGHFQQLAYDDAHRLVQKTDRRGYSFLYSYDAEGRCVRSGGQDGAELITLTYKPVERTTLVTRSDGGVESFYYDAQGTIGAVLDPCGGSATYRTDERGRVVEELDAHGNATRVLYGSDGTAVAKVDPLGHLRTLPLDDAAPDPLAHWVGESPLAWMYGRRHALPEHLPVTGQALAHVPRVARELIATSAPEWGGRTRLVRNGQGLPIREEREHGKPRRFAFDPNANLRWLLDADGHRTDYEHTSDNHLSATRDALGRVLRFEHSPYEKLTAFEDAGGTRSEYRYDQKDRLTEVRRHGRVRERYVYDAAGNLVEKHNGRGEPIFRAQYGHGNLEGSRTWSDGTSEMFSYDASGRLLRAEGKAGTCEFSYGPGGVRTRDVRKGPMEGQGRSLGVQHALLSGALVASTVLERFTTRYRELDAKTTEIVDPSGRVYLVRILEDGIYEIEQPSGLAELTQYDVHGRCLLKVVYDTRVAWPVTQRAYKYSGEGDLLAIEDAKEGTTWVEHDAAHRLSRIVHATGRVDTYAYDDGDNLVRMPGLSEELFPRVDTAVANAPELPVALESGNRLYRAKGERFHYDERDHVIARESDTAVRYYLRDAADQLVRIKHEDETDFEASYDPLGRRVSKTTREGTWAYYWDGDRLVAELFPDGRLRVYVFAALEALVPLGFVDYASVDAEPTSGQSYAITTNHLGTVERVYRAGGASPRESLAWSAHQEPYGLALVDVGEGFHQPLRMPGHYWDAETGLHYNRFRYYDPGLGRYLESDPLGIEGGANLYAYAGNPLRDVDVRGLTAKCPNGLLCRIKRTITTFFRRDAEGTDVEVKRSVHDAEPGKTFSDGRPFPPGCSRVCYTDGTHTTTHYLDSQGRTIRVEAPLKPPERYEKRGAPRAEPPGFVSGRDDRGHLAPERGAPAAYLVNVRENIIPEHGLESNQGPKAEWERKVIREADRDPNGNYITVHEPVYEGDNPRPTRVEHRLYRDGEEVDGFFENISNPER